jgi:hypothetical protein
LDFQFGVNVVGETGETFYGALYGSVAYAGFSGEGFDARPRPCTIGTGMVRNHQQNYK